MLFVLGVAEDTFVSLFLFFLDFQQRANFQIRELLKTQFRSEVLLQQAHSAKFQAKTAFNRRVCNALLVADAAYLTSTRRTLP